MASPLPQSMYAVPDRSMSPPGLPMVIPVGLFVMVVSLIFGFSYFGAGDWYIGVVVTVVGLVIVMLMFFFNEQQDEKHHRPPSSLRFDRRLFLLGTLVTMLGMIVILVAGGVFSGIVTSVVLILGIALTLGGIFAFTVSLRG